MRLSVYVHGQINRTGLGQLCEHIVDALTRAAIEGVRVHHIDLGADSSARGLLQAQESRGDAVHLFFRRESADYLGLCSGRRVIWWLFESDRLPPKWLRDVEGYDEVWLPSEWAERVLLSHETRPSLIRRMDLGVAADTFKPQHVPHNGFVFLSVGKYEKRKSIEEIISAFVEEFPATSHPQVKLWLKADYPLFPDRILELTQRVQFDNRILAVTGEASVATIAKLYAMADAFVFPSKAEGFGLACIEALASGIPVLATDFSGQSSFLSAVAGRFQPIAYDVVPLVDPDYQRFYQRDYGNLEFGSWAQPRLASIRYGMRELFEHPTAWRARASEASEIIRKRFSWDVIAHKVLGSLISGGEAHRPTQRADET